MSHHRDPKNIQGMFDRISPRYDLLNRLISLGRDIGWRKTAVEMIGPLSEGETVLDLCCGTGDFIAVFHKRHEDRVKIIALDFSAGMLDAARIRFPENDYPHLLLGRADAMSLPCGDETISAVTIGFGIRNVADRPLALREIYRVLKPASRLVMIEPAQPPGIIMGRLFSFYFQNLSPIIGGMISGDRAAYKYLNDSFVAFPKPDQFLEMMRSAGFQKTKAVPQTFGTAMIYYGEKK